MVSLVTPIKMHNDKWIGSKLVLVLLLVTYLTCAKVYQNMYIIVLRALGLIS